MGRQRIDETREEFNSRMRQHYKENTDTHKKYSSDYYAKQRKIFLVYAHLSEEGAIYIGSGNLKRYKETSSYKRNEAYNKAFKGVKTHFRVLGVFQDKESAKKIEQDLIDVIGLEHLINQTNVLKR